MTPKSGHPTTFFLLEEWSAPIYEPSDDIIELIPKAGMLREHPRQLGGSSHFLEGNHGDPKSSREFTFQMAGVAHK